MDIANCRRFQPSLCCHQLNSFVGLEGKKMVSFMVVNTVNVACYI